MFSQHLIIKQWVILNLKQTFGSLNKCVLLALRKSGPVWTFSIGISKVCAWDWIDNYPQSRLFKDHRPEIGSGYFLMHSPWTSLLLLEVMESDADTHKVSRRNWIKNYREIKKDSERWWSQRKGHKLSDSRDSSAQGLIIRTIYKSTSLFCQNWKFWIWIMACLSALQMPRNTFFSSLLRLWIHIKTHARPIIAWEGRQNK